jgi:hypothetical protein
MFTQSPQFNYVGSLFTCHFMNYSNSTTYKTMLGRQGTASSTAGGASLTVSLWRNTSAITSIQLQLDFGSSNRWYTGSTFTLYGIKAAS